MALVHGSIPTTDHDHILATEEVAIADCAVRDTAPGELVLTRYSQLVVGAAGGDDQALCRVAAVIGMDGLDRLVGLFDTLDLGILDIGAEASGLLLHHHGQFLALDSLGEAGVVLDFVGDQQLSAGPELLDYQGLEHRPGGVQASGKAGSSCAKDNCVVVGRGCRHVGRLPFLFSLRVLPFSGCRLAWL